jgi:polyhydroxybutyrate depolymerase
MLNMGTRKKTLSVVASIAAIAMVLCCLRPAGGGWGVTTTAPQQNAAQPATSHAGYTLGLGDHDFTLTYGGIERMYRVHVPSSYDRDMPTPLVLYLHGGGGSIQEGINDKMPEYSDKYGFILVFPAGTGLLKERLLTWNAGKWSKGECCGPAVKDGVDDVGFVSRVIDEAGKNFNVDGKRVYATGISNGGMMAYRLACELSDRIAAAAPVSSPAVPDECNPKRNISIMHVHGTADPCAPYNGGPSGNCFPGARQTWEGEPAAQQVNYWVEKDGCSANTTVTYQRGNATCISHNCSAGSEVVFCTIEGAGHGWPSGYPFFSEERIGPISHDISFDQMWEFFKRHPMT